MSSAIRGTPKGCLASVRPFLRVFNALGIFANVPVADRLAPCTRCQRVICLLWITLFVGVACLEAFLILFVLRQTMANVMFGVRTLVTVASLTFDGVTSYVHRNLVANFFAKLEQYDAEATRIGHPREDSVWPFRVALLAITTTVVAFLVVSREETDPTDSVSMIFRHSYTLAVVVQTFCSLKVALMLHLALQRARHLGRVLAPRVSWDDSTRSPDSVAFEHARRLFVILYDSLQLFDSVHSNALMLRLADLLLSMLICAYEVVTVNATLVVLFTALVYSQTVALCTLGHCIPAEMHEAVSTIMWGKLDRSAADTTAAKIANSAHFVHMRVSINGGEFFVVDLQLLLSMLGTTLTYLIVLLQKN